MSGRWRPRISGGRDEFSEKRPELTSEQREHLTRVTEELLQRYSISRTTGPDGAADGMDGEPVSAHEIGAMLESVLAEAFDFGWFTRPDLPEAPELTFEPESTTPDRGYAHEDVSFRAREPLEWPDPQAETDDTAPSAAEWERSLGPPRAVERAPESELLVPDEPDEKDEPDGSDEPASDVVPVSAFADTRATFPAAVADARDQVDDLATEVAELEEVHRAAVEAEREAILFAAATRHRLAEARERLAEVLGERDADIPQRARRDSNPQPTG